MARLSEFHQLLGLVMHSLDLPNQHISSVVIGSRQLAEEQRCGKSEAFFLREFVHSGHIESPCFCRKPLKLHGRDFAQRNFPV
jgi:hypothetical protein